MNKLTFTFFSFFLILSVSFLGSCEGKDDYEEETPISITDLPQKSQEFLQMYYKGIEVEKIEKEEDGGIMVYVVDLANGHEVVFNSEGEWDQVDAPFGETIPTGFIPESIMEYLNENYSGYGVNEINKTGYGYKVQLVTELDLKFNDLGQFLGLESED